MKAHLSKWANDDNLLLKTDSYKLTHWKMYPEGTEAVYSYFESRKGASFPFTLFFGLQHILQTHLEGVRVLDEEIDAAEEFVGYHLGDKSLFNRAGWEIIAHEYGGRLPLKIKAVPEGLCVPTGNVLMTVENTDDRLPWLTNYVETILTHVWYSSTVATLSKWVKNEMERLLGETGNPEAINFMLHDFGFRGAASYESAGIGGAAHLINFLGTDTIPAMVYANEFYEASWENLAFSVPASEHSVMTSLGREGEIQMLDQLLDTFPTGILSVVADSYNIYDFTNEVVERADRILARDGRFVLRPDSITKSHKSPQELVTALMKQLWEGFGGTLNSKGYKVLNDHVRVLWGDGIDHHGIVNILKELKVHGYAADNMVFGMGGGLLQKVNRDTQRFAFKCSAQKRNGEWHDVSKQPLDSSKASKAGRLVLAKDQSGYITLPAPTEWSSMQYNDQLQTVFENGEILINYTFDEIRKNANG